MRPPHIGRLSACPDGPADRGSATVLVLAAAALVWAVGLLGLALGAVGVLRARAATAADLAALAAAQAWPADGCRVAGRVSAAHDADLVACTSDDLGRVAVRVHLASRGWPPGVVEAVARAGPVSGPVGP